MKRFRNIRGNTMNGDKSLNYAISEEIKENYGEPGYWKQSLVCSIAYHGEMSMTEAWAELRKYLEQHEEAIQWAKVDKEKLIANSKLYESWCEADSWEGVLVGD